MSLSASQLFDIGRQHRLAARWREAEGVYLQILKLRPDDPDALHLLGLALFRQNRPVEAQDLIRRAISLNPQRTDYVFNLGLVLKSQGRTDEAANVFRDAIAAKADFAECYLELAEIEASRGQLESAIDVFRRGLTKCSSHARLHRELGRRLAKADKIDESIAELTAAIALEPGDVEAYRALGSVYLENQRHADAVALFKQAIAQRPNDADLLYGLGMSLIGLCQNDDAIEAFERAIGIRPTFVAALTSEGVALKELCRLDEALARFERVLAIDPENSAVESNRVFTLLYQPAVRPQDFLREARQWDERHAKRVAVATRKFGNDRDPERRLRVGYVSPDFHVHAESFFTAPLLEHHDHRQFEIFGYYGSKKSDQVTARIRACMDHWQITESLTDSQLAEQIVADRIDILIDVTMHMAHHRLLAFARKPAPIQITWLAYPGTTGLSAMDYRLTDSYLDEPGCDESIYSERSIRLPHWWLCYDPLISIPTSPPREPGPVRFGSLNNPCKHNEPTLQTWRRLLNEVPDSRLIISILGRSHGERIASMMQSGGVDPRRIEFVGPLPRDQYLQKYHRIDIALDPLPYNGITTTCDALWMGVPVVTQIGAGAPGRAGKGILSTLKLPQWTGRDPEEFARIARDLTSDLPALARWRSTLRERMEKSPIMDGARFAKNVEAVYRDVWRKWCASGE